VGESAGAAGQAEATEQGAVGRRERRKLEVVQRIRQAAADLFAEKGYHATTVEEIAARADVAKATFFNHFPRKDALLRAVAEDMLDLVREEFGSPSVAAASGVDALRRLFHTMAGVAEEHPSLYRALVIEHMRTFWDRQCGDETEAEFRRLGRGLLGRAVELGEVDSAVDVETGTSLLEAAYMTTMIEWLREGAARGAVRRTLDAKFDVIFRGLGWRARGKERTK
jgi:TetR/AcrR family transcriptional regulator, cholesterol catabolism regulator